MAATSTRSNPAESEAAAAAKLSKLEVALSALDAESPEGKHFKSVIDKTRVHAGQGHPSKRLDECQKYMVRAGKRLELAKQAVATAVAEQERLQEEYNIGSARLEELKREASAIPPPIESNNSKSPNFAKKGTICDRTVQRRSELARSLWTSQNWFPKRWKSCHSGSRPHIDGHGAGRSRPCCRVVCTVSNWRDEVGQCQAEVQSRICTRCFEKNRQSRYGLRGVRVGEASNPGPQSSSDGNRFSQTVSARGAPNPCRFQAHLPTWLDMTVADTDEESGVHEADGFVPVSSQRIRRRGGFVGAMISPLSAEIEAGVDHPGFHPPMRRRRREESFRQSLGSLFPQVCPLNERSTRRLVLTRADMPQSVQDLHEVATDDEGEGYDESIPVFDPVDADDDTDSVIDALQRDLEGDAIPADTSLGSDFVGVQVGVEPNPIAVRRRRRLVLVQGPHVESVDTGSVGDVPAARDDPIVEHRGQAEVL